VLFDSVIQTLQLRESDYFGLEYTNDESMPVSCGLDVLCMFLLPARLCDELSLCNFYSFCYFFVLCL